MNVGAVVFVLAGQPQLCTLLFFLKKYIYMGFWYFVDFVYEPRVPRRRSAYAKCLRIERDFKTRPREYI